MKKLKSHEFFIEELSVLRIRYFKNCYCGKQLLSTSIIVLAPPFCHIHIIWRSKMKSQNMHHLPKCRDFPQEITLWNFLDGNLHFTDFWSFCSIEFQKLKILFFLLMPIFWQDKMRGEHMAQFWIMLRNVIFGKGRGEHDSRCPQNLFSKKIFRKISNAEDGEQGSKKLSFFTGFHFGLEILTQFYWVWNWIWKTEYF